jgi:hypothetical protein
MISLIAATKASILSLALFANLNGFNYNPSVISDYTLCEMTMDVKVLYIKRYKNGDIGYLTEKGGQINIVRLKSGQYLVEEIDFKNK